MAHSGTTPATANEHSRASCQIKEWRSAKQVAQIASTLERDVHRSYRMPISGLDCFRACFVNVTILSSWRSTLVPTTAQCMEKSQNRYRRPAPRKGPIQTLARSEPMTRKVSESCIGLEMLAFSSSAQHRRVHQLSSWNTHR